MGHYIKKLFVVSDNDAYNRLYEFCGQAYLNEQLNDKGFNDLHLVHRLSAPQFDRLANQKTNPVLFYNEEKPLYYQGQYHHHMIIHRILSGSNFYRKEMDL